ncbi:MAG: TrkA family potassium uptake protein [Chloroflexi bacterium]|nr:TrkA family potassium uptake protein [Chloroflexota bacterium]
MRVIVMGCGRVGSAVAGRVAASGHDVTVLDTDPYSFRRLPPGFDGQSLVGDGTRRRSLEDAGIRGAEAFLALTQGDNRNILASQIAKHIYRTPTVVTRVYDPYRAEIFGRLGLVTFSPTNVGADMACAALFGSGDAGDGRAAEG